MLVATKQTDAVDGESPVGSGRCGWQAIDVDAERRLEAKLLYRPSGWRLLFNWLYEYNRY